MSDEDDPVTLPARPGAASERPPARATRPDALGAEGRYLVEQRLADGGMGVVLRVVDRPLSRTVAQKRLLPALSGSEQHARLLVREARVTARLDHPHIVPVHDLGMSDDGELFFTMKLVEGRTLAEWIASRPADQPPPWDELLDQIDVVIKVCDALSFAHARGVLHCDIKPSNVMVGEHGQVYLMDFGVARLLRDEQERAAVDDGSEGPLEGTPAYMSREQVLGLPLDERADVFALGGLLYHVICGRPPYRGGTEVGVLAEALRGTPRPPLEVRPSIPPALARIATRALAASPEDRYGSVRELKAELVRFVRGGEAFEQVAFEAGATIVREGDDGDAAFILETGRCEVTIGGEPVREMGPGEVFGELALLSSGTRTATVTALERTVLRKITGASFREELGAMKPWMGALLRTLAARLEERG